MKSMPKMVENQCGLSDSTQSMAMKVTLKPQKIRPGPAERGHLAVRRGVAVAILVADQRLTDASDRSTSRRNTTAARIRKNGTFR